MPTVTNRKAKPTRLVRLVYLLGMEIVAAVIIYLPIAELFKVMLFFVLAFVGMLVLLPAGQVQSSRSNPGTASTGMGRWRGPL